MAIPAVNIIWDDQSQINRTDGLINEDNIDRPIVMTVITADKGPEEGRRDRSDDGAFKQGLFPGGDRRDHKGYARSPHDDRPGQLQAGQRYLWSQHGR